jgi:hypothetical protein
LRRGRGVAEGLRGARSRKRGLFLVSAHNAAFGR